MKTHLVLLALVLCTAFPSGLISQESLTVNRQTNVMSQPQKDATVLDVLAPGVSVEIMGRQGQWAMVRLPGTVDVGWIESSVLAQPAGTVGRAAGAGRKSSGADLTDNQMSILRNRVSALDGSLYRVERQVDRLVDKVTGRGSTEPQLEESHVYPSAGEKAAVAAAPETLAVTGLLGKEESYRWFNSFVMGKYFRGGEDLYGLTFSRSIDRAGLTAVYLDAVYGMGDDRGQADDFIEWGLGFRFNIKRSSYWIYPFLEAGLGMRHRVGDIDAGPLRYLACSPGGGVKAELGEVFSMEAASNAVLLFADGTQNNEGRITLSVSFGY